MVLFVLFILSLSTLCLNSWGQTKTEIPPYSRTNTFGFFAMYSNDSSHMLLGYAENRKLLSFGASYSRRLLHNGFVNWQYDGELIPVALESDPVVHFVNVETSPQQTTTVTNTRQPFPCRAVSGDYNDTVTINGVTTVFTGTITQTCPTQWTVGEAMSPIGFQWNFRPRHRLQPFFVGHGGYMYSTTPIPTDNAGSFNFMFDFGPGVELYRSATKSIRLSYRYHHISNHFTAADNPGIDNGVFQVTYAFGR
jgi:hypothetical protein